MKIKKEIGLDKLEKYGFYKIKDDNDYVIDDELCFELGHSRRGQFYYYMIDEDRNIRIYASKPDGSGGSIILDDIILEMYSDGIIE